MMITDTTTGVPQVKAGKLRALGVSTAKRMAILPEVPTIAEAGVKGYDIGYWFAAYVPANTPKAVVERLHALLVEGTTSAAATSFYAVSGSDAWTTSPEELGRFQAGRDREVGPGHQGGGHRAGVMRPCGIRTRIVAGAAPYTRVDAATESRHEIGTRPSRRFDDRPSPARPWP